MSRIAAIREFVWVLNNYRYDLKYYPKSQNMMGCRQHKK